MKPAFNRQTKLFLVSTILYGIAFSFWELFFNIYILSRGIPKDTLGLIRTSVPLAALILGLPLGKLADRIGQKRSMLIGLAVGLLGMFLQVFLKDQNLIFLMGFVQGAGLMLYRVAVPSFIMSNSNENNRAVLFSLNYSLTTFAAMVGSLLAGQLPSLASRIFFLLPESAAAYQAVIIAGIFLGATSLIPILFFSDPVKPKAETGIIHGAPRLSLRELFRIKIIRNLFIRNLIVGLGAALLVPYFNVFFRENHQMSDQNLGYLFSVSSLFVVVGTLLAPWISRVMHGKIRATILTQSVSIIFLLLTGFSPWMWLAQISFLMRTVFMQLASPLLDNFAMEISPEGQQSTISSISGVGWQLGQSMGLFISGLVQVRYGFSPLFITTAFLYTISVIFAWVFFRPIEKKLMHARI